MRSFLLVSGLLLTAIACSSTDSADGKNGAKSGPGANGGTKADAGADGVNNVPTGPTQSVSCTVAHPATAIPAIAGSFPSLSCLQRGGSLTITVDPIDGAKDYRVYALPKDSDVVVDGGTLTGVKNAVYRCAGTRQVPAIDADKAGDYVVTLTDGKSVGGYVRPLEEATLGHVFTTPADGRVPVYALGTPDASKDLGFSFHVWEAARDKTYTASQAEHDDLVGKGWLDYGIAFYVPAAGAAGTAPVYQADVASKAHVYFSSAGEVAQRGSATAAFSVLKDATEGTEPLMRVFYSPGENGEAGHDELAVGKAYFERVRHQGSNQPSFDLHMSGITADTTLVVEALDDGCPFQGVIGDHSIAKSGEFVEWFTADEIKNSTPNGEVFLNGQNDAAPSSFRPKAIARSFIQVKPAERPAMDWSSKFETAPETFTNNTPACSSANLGCDAGTLHTLTSSNFDVTFNGIEADRWSLTSFQGSLWSTFTDFGADVAGQLRMTPKQSAHMNADTFLHVVMDVNAFTTARRYPQIGITDQRDRPLWLTNREAPNGHTIMFQPFNDWPNTMAFEVCDGRGWAVNDHCPTYDLRHLPNGDIAPVPQVGEQTGEDKLNRFELYVSSSKAYVFFDEKPYGCMDLTASMIPQGEVNVTFGDVDYHSGADEGIMSALPQSFEHRQKLTVVQRHFDYMGFSSGVPAPAWPASLPCATELK